MVSEPCQFDQQLLSRYVSCDCDSEERMRVERHVRTCRRCRRELYELEAVWSVLEEWQVDEAEAPFRPEALRAGLERRFGEPRRFVWWQGFVSSLWGWGVLRPLPVAVMVGLVAGLLAWWDTFTGPRMLEPTLSVARVEATPTPKVLSSGPSRGTGYVDIKHELCEMDPSVQNLRRIQNLVGVQIDGPADDIRSALNRPSTPLPFDPPKANVIFASAHSRL